jgi:hypothetical protein
MGVRMMREEAEADGAAQPVDGEEEENLEAIRWEVAAQLAASRSYATERFEFDSWVARLAMGWDGMRCDGRRSQLGLEVKSRLVERLKARILAMARDYFVLVEVAVTIGQPRKCQHRPFFGGV